MATFVESHGTEPAPRSSLRDWRRKRSETIIGKLIPLLQVAVPVIGRWLVRVRTALLTIGGLGLITLAAWTVAVPLGLLVGGVSLLWLQYLTAPDDKEKS